MRSGLLLSALLALPALASAQAPPPAAAADKPVRVAYYYKVRWGFQDEFERLFLKNHYPVLEAQTKAGGRLRSVNMYKPIYHGDGRADWTFAVVIVYSNWAAFQSVPGAEEALARRLFPDQDTFRKEEQRRFEILDAHWDVPLVEVEPKSGR